MSQEFQKRRKRYHILDYLKCFTLVSMIIYHAMWDVVYILGKRAVWYESDIGYFWQQSICWVFILLSGFCWSLGKEKWKRGLVVSLAGVLITLSTLIVMPENKVVFGVLTLLGSCMLLLIPLDRTLRKMNPFIGLLCSILLFMVFRNINMGYLGFESFNIMQLPQSLYCNLLTTFLGMPTEDFASTDYFSLFPWLFLYVTGYFIYQIMETKKILDWLECKEIPGLTWMGKHSLIIYMLHQPLLYAGMMLCIAD